MPRASASLLGAYRRYGGHEDPLTELFATALDAYLPFASALLTHRGIDLPSPAAVEVSTQVRTDVGRRVDLEVIGLAASGAMTGRLWSENKVGAAYQPDQLGSYKRSLGAMPAPTRLVTIVLQTVEASTAEALSVPVLTWQEIADTAWKVASRQAASIHWRRHAVDQNAPSGLRVLAEFLDYMEEELEVTLEPVTYEHVNAFQLANSTAEVLVELLERAVAHADKLAPDGPVGVEKDNLGFYWQCFIGGPSWLKSAGGQIEVTLDDSDEWTLDRLEQPAIGAGAALPEALYDDLRAPSQGVWRDTLAADGFVLGMAGGKARVYRTVYLAELTAKGATLDGQAAWLATWLEETVALLGRHDPELVAALPK